MSTIVSKIETAQNTDPLAIKKPLSFVEKSKKVSTFEG